MRISAVSALRRLLLLAALVFSGSWFATARAAETTPAFVRIIHASPDIGIVDVFVDGTEILNNFQFGTVTDYVPLPQGTHTLRIALLGTGINAAVITQMLTVSEGVPYTIAALGTKAKGFSLTVFKDDNLITGNGAKVRVYHLSQVTGSVNVLADKQTIANGLSYPHASSYVSIPAGSYMFNLTGSTQATPDPLTTTLKPWTVTSIFAIGPEAGKTQVQFISTQLAGTPGMPQTGSDPDSPVSSSTPALPWLPAVLVVLAWTVVVGSYRMKRTNRS
jgi:hypothetical protein